VKTFGIFTPTVFLQPPLEITCLFAPMELEGADAVFRYEQGKCPSVTVGIWIHHPTLWIGCTEKQLIRREGAKKFKKKKKKMEANLPLFPPTQ